MSCPICGGDHSVRACPVYGTMRRCVFCHTWGHEIPTCQLYREWESHWGVRPFNACFACYASGHRTGVCQDGWSHGLLEVFLAQNKNVQRQGGIWLHIQGEDVNLRTFHHNGGVIVPVAALIAEEERRLSAVEADRQAFAKHQTDDERRHRLELEEEERRRIENQSSNISSLTEPESNGKWQAEVPELFRKLADDGLQLMPLPDIDLNVNSPELVVNNLIEAVDSLDLRMPLAFQDQQQILKMQGEMLQLGVDSKELYKKIHEQSVMRCNLEKNVNKNIEELEKGAAVAEKLVKAKNAYDEMVAKAEALLKTK